MELKKVVRVLTVAIALCAIASSASLIVITSYLHGLTREIDSNLQSVRAAQEIELQLLWHARSTHQASLTSAPELSAAAAEAQANVFRWLETARLYVGSEEEIAVLATLESELDTYFAKQEELAASALPALQRNVEAAALFDETYGVAEELLRINVEQAATVAERATTWDRVSTGIGFSLAITLLALTAILIIGARGAVYRPLLALGDAIRGYAARDYSVRAPERGPAEIRAIAGAFNQMAEELQRQRAQQLVFVASVAHDLRNPLAAMKAAVGAIEAAGCRGDSARPSLTAVVSRQIDLLERMISDLLDSARIESGNLTLVAEDLDARDLARDAVDLFRAVAPLHEIVTDVPETPLPVHCDGARITQVVNNLLSNAIKYSPQGGRIEVRAGSRASGVEIEVADQGVGIPAEEWGVIFEPFQRGRMQGWAIPGVGIGLSVAQRIVEAHGGTITVRSLVGIGSTFSVWIPSGAAAAPRSSAVDASRRWPNANGGAQPDAYF